MSFLEKKIYFLPSRSRVLMMTNSLAEYIQSIMSRFRTQLNTQGILHSWSGNCFGACLVSDRSVETRESSDSLDSI